MPASTRRRPDRPDAPHVAALDQLRTSAAAVSLAHHRVTVSHSGAAALLGLWLITTPELVCATYPRGRRGPMPGVHRHRARLFPGHVVRDGRILLSSAARTVVDLGRESGADAAIVAADSALRDGLTTRSELAATLATCAGWPGVRAAARAIELADPRSESPLESLSRLRMSAAGLPAPETQVCILNRSGHFLGRVDFYWDEFGVVGEADGLGKYDGELLSPREEKVRQGRLEDCGLIFVRWGWADLWPFDPTAARLRAAFARGLRADPGAAGLARRSAPAQRGDLSPGAALA